MAYDPNLLDVKQLLLKVIDFTDPENPVVNTFGSGGGGGGPTTDVDVTSIAPGDNNIGNVDVVSLPSIPAGTNLIGKVAQVPLASAPYAAISVGTSATALVAAIDDTRKALSIFNNGLIDLCCGPDGSITTSNAPIIIAPGTGTVIEKGDGFARFRWYGIVATGTVDARVMEGKE